MSKSKSKVVRDEEDSNNAYRNYEEYRRRKRDKHINSALKTKNIEDLSRYAEEDE